MAKTPKVGSLLQATPGVDQYKTVRVSPKGAQAAAAEALQAYLLGARFVVGAGKDGLEVPFQLEAVELEWPDPKPGEELVYPSAAITAATVPHAEHSFAPTALEDTIDRFCKGTVLWKTNELQIDFQLDIWTTDKPMREALNAALPALFNPGEDRRGIMVQGPAEYFCQSVRLTLIEHEILDDSESAFSGERRIRALVRADIDDVHLREAVLLEPSILPVDQPLD